MNKKIFDFISFANKYFDENEPWNLAKTDKNQAEKILYNCCNIIYNVNNILKPYLIESTPKVEKYLNKSIDNWEYRRLDEVNLSKEIEALFDSIDTKTLLGSRDYALLEFMYGTGVRVSELCSIKENDIDYINKQVIVLGKGKKERYLPYSPYLVNSFNILLAIH